MTMPSMAGGGGGGGGGINDEKWERSWIPDKELECPITRTLMKQPVLASDGYTYEQSAIAYWLQTRSTSPVTNAEMPNKDLMPNLTIRTMTATYRQKVGAELLRLALLLSRGGTIGVQEPAPQQAAEADYVDGHGTQSDPKLDTDNIDDKEPEELDESRHRAICYRRLEFLLDHGADPDVRDADGNSALVLCTKAGRADLVALLLSRGADVMRSNDAQTHDIIEVARGLPSNIAREMVDVLMPAVQSALEKQREKMASLQGSSEDGAPGQHGGRSALDGGQDEEESFAVQTAQQLLPGFPQQINQWNIQAGMGFFPSLFALQFHNFMSKGTFQRLPPREEVQLDKLLAKYVSVIMLTSLVILWLL